MNSALRPLVAVLATLAFVAGGSVWSARQMQADLDARARQALQEAEIVVAVEFTGRDAVLRGTLPDAASQARAVEVVTSVAGARRVDSRITVSETGTPPSPDVPPGSAPDDPLEEATADNAPADRPGAATGAGGANADDAPATGDRQTVATPELPAGLVLFDFGESEVPAAAEPYLDAVAAALRATPDLRVTVEGHTDNVSSDATNFALSKERADAVAAALVERGVAADRISTGLYGATKPVATNDTPEGRQANRRTEIVLEQEG